MWPTSIATTPSGRSSTLKAWAPNWIPWIDRWENENIDKPQWAAWKLSNICFCCFFFLQSAECMGCILMLAHWILCTVHCELFDNTSTTKLADERWWTVGMNGSGKALWLRNIWTMWKLKALQRLLEQQGWSQSVIYNHLFTCNLKIEEWFLNNLCLDETLQ